MGESAHVRTLRREASPRITLYEHELPAVHVENLTPEALQRHSDRRAPLDACEEEDCSAHAGSARTRSDDTHVRARREHTHASQDGSRTSQDGSHDTSDAEREHEIRDLKPCEPEEYPVLTAELFIACTRLCLAQAESGRAQAAHPTSEVLTPHSGYEQTSGASSSLFDHHDKQFNLDEVD